MISLIWKVQKRQIYIKAESMLWLTWDWRGGKRGWLQIDTRDFWGLMECSKTESWWCDSVNLLKFIELSIQNRWISWYVNYTPIKLFKRFFPARVEISGLEAKCTRNPSAGTQAQLVSSSLPPTLALCRSFLWSQTFRKLLVVILAFFW